jgi:hypothetical protein
LPFDVIILQFEVRGEGEELKRREMRRLVMVLCGTQVPLEVHVPRKIVANLTGKAAGAKWVAPSTSS